MALAQALTEKNLPKFRTKKCERLLTKNSCSYGDKCQYAHAVPRRNPQKVSYSPQMCPNFQNCPNGDNCLEAHTVEEALFHPAVYRTRMRPERLCLKYYCPFAHSEEELRPGKPFEVPPPAPPPVADLPPAPPAHCTGPLQPGAVRRWNKDLARNWWAAGDQKDLYVRLSGEVPSLQSYGRELLGGLVRPALHLPCPSGGWEEACFAKLLSTTRTEAPFANMVVKDLKRWLSKYPAPLPSPFFLRRTIATTTLALPDNFRVLGKTLETLPGGVLHQVRNCWAITHLAAKWIQQLVKNLEALHDLNVAHTSICLSTVLVGRGVGGVDIRLGDFLGKVSTLRFLENGCCSLDDSWAMWYPAEVHKYALKAVPAGAASRASNNKRYPDLMKVDSWQLGVLIFCLLTGDHPFGDMRYPAQVCSNIQKGKVENRKKLRDLPLFLELVDRLLDSDPQSRLKVELVLDHPLFWELHEGFEFAKPLLEDDQRSPEKAWLYHLPCFAVFAPTTSPASPDAAVLEMLCHRVLGNGKRRPKGLDAIGAEVLAEIDKLWANARHQVFWVPPPPSTPPPPPPMTTLSCFQAGMRQGVELMVQFAPQLVLAPPGLLHPGGGRLEAENLLQRCSEEAAKMVYYQQQLMQGAYQAGHSSLDGTCGDGPESHCMLMSEYDNASQLNPMNPNPSSHPQLSHSTFSQRDIMGSPSRATGQIFSTTLEEAPRTPKAVRMSRDDPTSGQKLRQPNTEVECVTRYLDKGIKGRCMVEDHLLPSALVQDLGVASKRASGGPIYRI